jgi:transposase
VGEGKSEEALKPFRELLGKRKNKIVAVAIDMGAAYQKALRENIPNAAVVFDHFHVIKLMNERIDRPRREVYRNASDNDQTAIRGSRHLLLKNPENLS